MKKIPFHYSILIGMVAGAGFGLLFPEQVHWIKPLGVIFIKLLKMLVVPLIFVSIIHGIDSVGSPQNLSRLGIKTLAYYIGTNILAVTVSMFLVNLVRPGDGMTVFGEKLTSYDASFNVLDWVPDNIFHAFVNVSTIQIIFIAILFGLAIVAMRDQVKTIRAGLEEANKLLLKVTTKVIGLAPFGVFALIADMIGSLDFEALSGVFKFAIVILGGLLIHGLITLPILLKIFSGRPILEFAKQMQPALLAAFSTSSSSATLPITMECMTEEAKMTDDISGFVLPIGATVNMDGTAMYEAVACMFIAQALGVDLSFTQQLVVFFMASVAAMGAASIPSAGLVTLTMVLSAVGLPLEGIGFLFALDRPFDMSRTAVNVWGDMVGCAVIEGKKK
ncbi:MAG: dicarboxylate/amino acid:cation symporter [Candidatus Omnitrophota bacterium]|nr:dicarboxylate/amino acid:cation symporter [Candidatus Omnitrophota bacterium]